MRTTKWHFLIAFVLVVIVRLLAVFGCSPVEAVILMGDYSDREAGFVPLVYHTKRFAFLCGLKQCATDIIRFSHGASSSTKVYKSSFIPGLHDVVSIFEKA